MVYAIFILISFLASVIGCICGIGGGVVGRKINKKIDNAGCRQAVYRASDGHNVCVRV